MYSGLMIIRRNITDIAPPVASPVVRKAPAITEAVSEYLIGTRLQ